MVDLVKIRRKAKEKKEKQQKEEQEAQSAAAQAADEATTEETLPPRDEPATPADDAPPVAPSEAQAEPAGEPAASPATSEPLSLGSALAAPALPAGPALPAEPPVGERRGRRREAPTAAAIDRLEEFRRTAGVQREGDGEGEGEATAEEAAQLELLVFHLGDEQYAVEISSILEITRPRSITRVPNAAEGVIGIMSLRGTIVTLLDVRRRLGHEALGSTDDEQRIIVVERDSEVAGFIVDRVYRVVRVDASILESHPVVSSNEQNRCVSGVFRHRDRITILLALDQLLERDS